MQHAENFKAKTVTLHFKVEELLDRFNTLCKFKIIRDRADKVVYEERFQEAEKAIARIRELQDAFDRLNFTPFVNAN